MYTLRTVNDATKEAPMGAPCMLPRKVGKMVWISDQLSFEENNGCFLGASYYMYYSGLLRRKHARTTHHFLSKQNWKITPKRQLFKEARMGASYVLPSVASLTGRSVCTLVNMSSRSLQELLPVERSTFARHLPNSFLRLRISGSFFPSHSLTPKQRP